MRRVAFMLALLSGTGSPACSEADRTGDSRAGRELALEICSSCHVVAADQKNAPPSLPLVLSFQEIARQSKTDASYLRGFLSSTHSSVSHPTGMPHPQLTADQVSDIVAYILSLRGK
jgi:mono/diheme cytochrome c family protein